MDIDGSSRALIQELADLAGDAASTKPSANVMDYWCELGEMVAALSIQTTGSFVELPGVTEGVWKMRVQQDSSAHVLCLVCDLARPTGLTWGRSLRPSLSGHSRSFLAQAFRKAHTSDAALDAARSLAQAVCSGPITSQHAASRAFELLECVARAAGAFEASWPLALTEQALDRDKASYSSPAQRNARAAYYYLRDRPMHRSDVSVQLLGAPAPPRPGDVQRALAACRRLAQGRLSGSEEVEPDHARYVRGTLTLPSYNKLELS